MSSPAGTDGAQRSQRERILDIALHLMSERGAHVMSMRQLARACDLNVATIYHYFPAKSELLRAVLEDKRYLELLDEASPTADPTLAPRQRLMELVALFLEGVVSEAATWRLLLGEGLRGEQVALDAVAALDEAIERTLTNWLAEAFPELELPADVAARAVRDHVFAFCVRHLVAEQPPDHAVLRAHAADVAALLFPS